MPCSAACGSFACERRSTKLRSRVRPLKRSGFVLVTNSSNCSVRQPSAPRRAEMFSPSPMPTTAELTLPQRALTALVRGYRSFLSPWLGIACRFAPTCSVYALQAIEKHGAGAGAYMTLHRLARCQPWCEGGHDPVPVLPPALFRSFASRAPAHGGVASPPPTDHKTSP